MLPFRVLCFWVFDTQQIDCSAMADEGLAALAAVASVDTTSLCFSLKKMVISVQCFPLGKGKNQPKEFQFFMHARSSLHALQTIATVVNAPDFSCLENCATIYCAMTNSPPPCRGGDDQHIVIHCPIAINAASSAASVGTVGA